MKKLITLLAVAGLVFALAPGALAQSLIVLDGTASTAKTDLAGRVPGHVTDGSGMTGEGATGTHEGDDTNEGWLSALGLPQWFRVDLGASYSVGTMYVWNGESGTGNLSGTPGVAPYGGGPARGVKQADIYYSSDDTAPGNDFSDPKWTLLGTAGSRVFTARANNTLAYTPTDAIDLNVTARVIGFDIKTDWGDYNNVASFNELQFFTGGGATATPGTLIYGK